MPAIGAVFTLRVGQQADYGTPADVSALSAQAAVLARVAEVRGLVADEAKRGRGPDVDGLPYAAWRARERSYANMVGVERMLRQRPGPAKRFARAWQWGGGRVAYAGPADSIMTRNVGPNDRWGGRLGRVTQW